MSTGTAKQRIEENTLKIGTMNTNINAIKTAINNKPTTMDATATENDIATGKTAFVKGKLITGIMEIIKDEGLKVYVQEEEPEEYNGIWIESTEYEYENVIEIASKIDVEPSSVNIVRGTSKNTKISNGELTYKFNAIYITDEEGEIIPDINVYYGNGSEWVDITPPVGNYAGVRVDFVNGTVTEIDGSVPVNELKCYSGRRRCNMQNDGTITAYYGENGYSNVGSENLQVMVEQPKAYYSLQNVEVNNGAITKADYLISDVKIDENYELHPAFIIDNEEYDYAYVGAFEGTVINNKLCSIGGGTTRPNENLLRSTARTYTANRGSIWRQLTKQYSDLESLMITIEYKSFNHQSVLAYGVSNSSYKEYVGQNYSLNSNGTGIRLGSVSSNCSFTWRWRENKYGNGFKYEDGINIYKDQWYIADHNFADGNASGYTAISVKSVNDYGWITRFAYVPEAKWIFMPKVLVSDVSGLIQDRWYMTDNYSWGGLCTGGNHNDTNGSGSFYMIYDGKLGSNNPAITTCLMAMPKTQ